jgi:hypothetical protein
VTDQVDEKEIVMKSHWMTHKGKKIFFADYSRMSPEALKEEVASVEPILCSMPKDSVLSLADVSGTYGTAEAMKIIKGITAKTKSHVHKRAVIGIVGVQKVLLKAVNQFSGQETVPFESIDKALDWLAEE